MKKCTSNSLRHKWEWKKNTTTHTQTLNAASFVLRGIYKCSICGVCKYGESNKNV